jgi:4'-phosphopantetheinyl transferase
MSPFDPPIDPFVLQPGEVHVWVASLDAPPPLLAIHRRLLAADEIERAERLRFEHLRARFVTGRAILRLLLGRYVQAAPEKLRFRYGAYGKPELDSFPPARSLAFNLAHSHNLAVYALALAPRIGVDVEQMRPVQERDQITERFFSPRERQALAALPDTQREEAFFLCWTRKEAYLKALGAGITYPLDRFSVSLTPGEPAVLLEAAEEDDAGQPWTLLPFTPASPYQAAVAVEGCDWTLHCREWE